MFRLSEVIPFPNEIILSQEHLVLSIMTLFLSQWLWIFLPFFTEGSTFFHYSFHIHTSLFRDVIRAHMDSNTCGLNSQLTVTDLVTTLTAFVSPQPSLFFVNILSSDVQLLHLALCANCSVARTSLLLFESTLTFRTNQHSLRTYTVFSITLLS